MSKDAIQFQHGPVAAARPNPLRHRTAMRECPRCRPLARRQHDGQGADISTYDGVTLGVLRAAFALLERPRRSMLIR